MLDIVILNLLHRQQRHGYEMVQQLKQIHGLQIREGNIYPVLARLQTEGLVENYTEKSTGGPPRKYFALTDTGRAIMDSMNEHWDQMIESIERIRKGVSE
jgi:PadR family transcriptional regulator PadR